MKAVTKVGRLCAVLILFLLAGCRPVTPETTGAAAAAETQALTPVRIGVGYIPSVQFAPFYVGMDKGFYAEEGLEVTLDYGFENDYLKLVGTDELQFMVGSGDQVIIGRAQGLPVRYVMQWFTRYPVALFAKADAGIREPADLRGRSVGIPGPFGATYVAYRGLLEAAGLSEADVRTESIGFTQAAAVSEGTVDAAVDYSVNGPVVLRHQGEEVFVLELGDYLTMPSNGLVTNEATLAEDPELVRRVVRATLRAIADTLEHPDDAFAISLKYVPEAGGENEAINRAVFDASLAFWQTPEGVEPGATAPADWEAAAEFMQRIGLIDTLPPVEELFTNDYLP
ncbi:MAG TPA: ABC transporter substrate-binding protein [Caldilineaceae bacterium]|nr:ABC transporter substrate-binding protein [Caldilineaceae bacterium]